MQPGNKAFLLHEQANLPILVVRRWLKLWQLQLQKSAEKTTEIQRLNLNKPVIRALSVTCLQNHIFCQKRTLWKNILKEVRQAYSLSQANYLDSDFVHAFIRWERIKKQLELFAEKGNRKGHWLVQNGIKEVEKSNWSLQPHPECVRNLKLFDRQVQVTLNSILYQEQVNRSWCPSHV